MRDYRPTYPNGFTPRYLCGEWSVPMDSAPPKPAAAYVVPAHVHCQLVPPGAAVRDYAPGCEPTDQFGFSNQPPEKLAAYRASAGEQSRRAKAVLRLLGKEGS